MDRLAAMKAFVTIVEAGGFAPAARRLRLSPPSITRLVGALEEQLSIRLLHRTTRSLSLTDAGSRYLERARRILADVDDAERSARAEHTVPTGRLVVAAPLVLGRVEVAPLLSDYLARYPAVRGELMLSDRTVDLVEEGIDVAVRIGALEDSGLRARTIGATRRVVVASPAYLARRKKLRSPRDLARHSFIQFTSLMATRELRFFRGSDETRVAVTPALVTNSADAAIAHAVAGGGLAMVLSYQVKELIQAGTLAIVLARHEPPPLPIQLVYPRSRLHGANLRAFIDLAMATRDWDFTAL